MPDKFHDFSDSLNSPPKHVYAISPDDGADLPHALRALNVSTTGFVQVTTVTGDTATLHVVAGTAFPIRANRIWETGTTATGLVGLY